MDNCCFVAFHLGFGTGLNGVIRIMRVHIVNPGVVWD